MEQKVNKILNEQFLQILSDENFDSSEYSSKLISKMKIEDLVELYFNYKTKNEEIDAFMEEFANYNQSYLKKQFVFPNKYGSCFDQIKNVVVQSQRKIQQAKEILVFNSEEMKKLNKEIKDLSSINEELIQIDQLNENMLDFSVFLKKELYFQSALLLEKIKINLKELNLKNQKIVSQNYFPNVVKKKETEFYFILKEIVFALIFDIFNEKYEKDSFNIFQKFSAENEDIQFNTENEKFIYFENALIKFKPNYSKYFNSDGTLNIEGFNTQIFKIDSMIELFFDIRVFDFLKKELENPSNTIIIEDLKYIEAINSAKIIGVIDKLNTEFISSFEFKFNQLLLKFSKFLIYELKNTQIYQQLKQNQKNDFENNYFILSNLTDIGFSDIFINLLMKLIVILWQKLAIFVKFNTEINDVDFNKIFQIFFSTLQGFIENIFLSKELITFFNSQFFELSTLIRKKFELNYTHLFLILNKINQPFQILNEKFCKFISKPQKKSVIEIHYNNFEDGLFLKFKIKFRGIFTKHLDELKEFNKIEKTINIKNDKTGEEIFKKNSDISYIIQYSIERESKFYQEISKKKYTIEIVENFTKFTQDLNFFLETNLVNNKFIYNQFMQFYNRSLIVIYQIIDQNILSQQKFKTLMEFQRDSFFKQNQKKIKHFLFDKDSQETFSKQQLESYLDNEKHFDFAKLKNIQIIKFWESEIEIEFYEKCFICFREFLQNEKPFLIFLIKMWQNLDQDTINRISLTLNVTFDLIEAKNDLKNVKKGLTASGKFESIYKKLNAGMDLPFYESIILIIHYYFQFQKLILNLLFYLKINFDYLIHTFFEESSQQIKTLGEYEINFFNTSNQIFEFKKLMTNYDKLVSNYIGSEDLGKIFVLNSLDLFYKRFHKFIFEIKPVFITNNKYIKNYYIEFSKILSSMSIMKSYHSEIIEKSSNYKLMKKLLAAENMEDLDEIGIFFNVEENTEEIEMTK